jgi:hypothetical protein
MDPQQAFSNFVQKVIVPEKAERYAALATSKKGHRKIIENLCHHFESSIRVNVICRGDYDRIWALPCYVFSSSCDFGAEFSSVREAYDQLSVEDSWLILLRDGSAGIYRPEDRWDDEKLISG